jgi:CheY-like chemotaxis protein
MPQGGELTIELSNAVLDDHDVAPLADVAAGQYVLLAVTDTGTGMSKEVLERAFDPFFTTKPEGKGTGLGLSMAYGFVKQSGGHIEIQSEPGRGTTVKIYLPRSLQPATELPLRERTVVTGGTETILVVEDDPKVQSTVIDTLSGLGYRVLKADTAQQALAVLQSGVHVDLLFSDVVMPGPVRSTEMVIEALQLLPKLKVLFTSGYTRDAIIHGGRLDPGVELLGKPYSREQLAHRIRQMLGGHNKLAAQAYEPLVPLVPLTPLTPLAPLVPLTPLAPLVPLTPLAPLVPPEPGPALRILFVDDDPNLSDAVKEQLTLLEQLPESTTSPSDALKRLQEQPFDVLITDLTMPEMDGIELARQAAAIRPSLCVVFSSGSDMPELPPLQLRWAALRKPFTIRELDAVLRGFHT